MKIQNMEVKKSDFIFFQNEILEDMKKLENKINNIIISNSNNLLEKVNLNKNNIEATNKKIFEIIKLVNNEDEKIKINSYIDKFKTKIDEFTFANDTKMTSLEKQLNELSFKYDKLIISNLTCPGFIGKGCEYSNLRSFLEYLREKLKELFNARDSQYREMRIYKEKLETLINQLKLQMNLNEAKFSLYVNDALKKFEVRTNERFKELENKILNFKADNMQLTNDVKKKMEDLNIQSEKMNEFKDDILIKFNKNMAEMKNESIKNRNENDLFKKEFKDLKVKFKEINHIVKDLKNAINKSQSENLTDNNNYMINQYKYFSNINKNMNIAYEQNKLFNEDLLNIRYSIGKNNKENIINNNQNIIFDNNKKNTEEKEENVIGKEPLNNKIDSINKNKDSTKILVNNDKIEESKSNINNLNLDENKDKNVFVKIDKIKNNEINDANLKKLDNINNNQMKNNTNEINSSVENNMHFQKREITETSKDRTQENKQNDFPKSLRKNNFRKMTKNEDKMNKTYNNNKKFLINRRYSVVNKDIPTISIVNYVIKNSNHHEKDSKEKINDLYNELNYNSDCVANSNPSNDISDIRMINFNKEIKKNKNILNLVKIKNIRKEILLNNNNFSEVIESEKEHNTEKRDNFCLSDGNYQKDNEKYLNKDEFYSKINETKKNIDELYFTFNKKIHKLTRQIKNLSAEIFNYHFSKKLNKKFSNFTTNNNSLGKFNLNSVIDLSPNHKELNQRKFNKKFVSTNNDKSSFTEEQNINSKLLLKKLDSFLIKKFKE